MHFYLEAEVSEIEPEQIWQPGNQPLRVKARSLVCYWAVRELGMSATSDGKLLGLGQPAVSRAVVRGEKLTQVYEFKLNKMRNAFFHDRPYASQLECQNSIFGANVESPKKNL